MMRIVGALSWLLPAVSPAFAGRDWSAVKSWVYQLGVDYAKTPACIADAYAQQRALGFVPYVTVVSLDVVLKEGETKKGGSASGKRQPK